MDGGLHPRTPRDSPPRKSGTVLRTVRGTNGEISVVEVATEDACCGPNAPLPRVSDSLYDDLFDKAAMTAASLFPPLVPQRTTGHVASSGRLVKSTRGDLDARMTQLSATSQLPGSGRYAQFVSRCSTHPKPVSGMEATRSLADSYLRRQDVLNIIHSLAEDAQEAKEALERQHRRELKEQGEMWERHAASLHAEIARLDKAARDMPLRDLGLASRSPRIANDDVSSDSRRSCGAAIPRSRLSPRHPIHQVSEAQLQASRDSGELNPKRITEALVHLLQKQPHGARRPERSSVYRGQRFV